MTIKNYKPDKMSLDLMQIVYVKHGKCSVNLIITFISGFFLHKYIYICVSQGCASGIPALTLSVRGRI